MKKNADSRYITIVYDKVSTKEIKLEVGGDTNKSSG